jgi:hypothetical protein
MESEKDTLLQRKEDSVPETAAAEVMESGTPENDKNKSEKKPVFKRISKWFLRGVAAVFLLLVILLAGILIFIDPIVKKAIVELGPEIAGVNIELEDISVQIFKGRVEITNMVIGNPQGYNSGYAAKLGDVAVETDISSWLGDGKKIFREIRVKNVTVNYETELPFDNHSNLHEIVDHIKKVSGKAPESTETAVFSGFRHNFYASISHSILADAQSADSEKRFQIDKLIVENVRVVVIPKKFPKFNAPITVVFPEMGPVGTNPEGLTAVEIAFALSEQLLLGIVDSVKISSQEIYQNLSTQGLQSANDLLTGTRKVINDARSDGKKVIENINETKKELKAVGEDAKQLWNTLFPKKEKKKEAQVKEAPKKNVQEKKDSQKSVNKKNTQKK